MKKYIILLVMLSIIPLKMTFAGFSQTYHKTYEYELQQAQENNGDNSYEPYGQNGGGIYNTPQENDENNYDDNWDNQENEEENNNNQQPSLENMGLVTTISFSIDPSGEQTLDFDMPFSTGELTRGINIIVIIAPPSRIPSSVTLPKDTKIDTQSYHMYVIAKTYHNQGIVTVKQKFDLETIPTNLTITYVDPISYNEKTLSSQTFPTDTTSSMTNFIQNSPIFLEYALQESSSSINNTINISQIGQGFSIDDYNGTLLTPSNVSVNTLKSIGFSIDPELKNILTIDNVFTQTQLKSGLETTLIILPPNIYTGTSENVQIQDTNNYHMIAMLKSAQDNSYVLQHTKVPLIQNPISNRITSGQTIVAKQSLSITSAEELIEQAPIILKFDINQIS